MRSQRQTSGNLALDQNNVIVIEAAQRPEAQKLRVAAYCRVSSDSSDQMNSFAAQMNYYTTLISGKENWTLVDLYADAGISGTSAESVLIFSGSSPIAAKAGSTRSWSNPFPASPGTPWTASRLSGS